MLCFFNIAGAVYDPGVEGMEMASLGEAREQAAKFVGEYIEDRPNVVWLGDEVRVEVTDANRLVLFTVIVMGVDAPATSQTGWG